MFRKILQLSLIHVAVAMTLVPINSTLNRVMIKEMALSATLVAVLASLPYLFSPTQVVIGSYSDRHPILGWRRSPYILVGLLLCVAGVALAPQAVFVMPENRVLGLVLTALTFGAWGMGFNLASVSYLSLASELTGEKGRTRTVAAMWFVMVIGIILTAAGLSRLLVDYTPAQLERAFVLVALAALVLGLLGIFGLEPRHKNVGEVPAYERLSWRSLIGEVLSNQQARRFFIYLVILLAAILGQDVLLEPFAAEAFNMPVEVTTRITSIWGGFMLVALWLGGPLERGMGKKRVAQIGAVLAIVGFVLIAFSPASDSTSLFYLGVVFLGAGTGLSTVSNLSLMLDMTTAHVGLYIGAWGIANALSRLIGSVVGGALRDLITFASRDALVGYLVVFLLEAGFLVLSLFILARIDVQKFRRQSGEASVTERAALLNDNI